MGLMHSRKYLITSTPALEEIIKRQLHQKGSHKCSSTLKSFAASLLFYSVSAYNFVRKSFLQALPHPQTVRKWFRNVDFQPGVSETALNAVQAKIEDLAKKTGRKMIFALMVDEMSIRRSIEWDGKNYHGFVDLDTGMSGDDMPEATYALVFMIVSINGHFKTPVAYYLVHNLSGQERMNLINECLFALHEHNIHVVSITSDGAASNISMVEGLGAKIRGQDIVTHFLHPVTKEPIFVLLDGCHMIKLVRNTFASYTLTDDSGSEIRWSYINDLVQIQEREGLHAATKVRRKHIRFLKEKMKDKLAVQVLSTSVADALNFFEHDIRYPEFANADATARFCRIFNNVLDILNSRNKAYKNPTQQCIIPENISSMEIKINERDVLSANIQTVPGSLGDVFLMCKRSRWV
ncbi:thap domain-containing protein 9-like protein [Lasius niger]|uniref:Thap domain-containing protein 9-like protein n=1 Tax=Lasius niger TaxID=67767 RepID=A0A0J7N4C9_LASNI|nr:thap domain-containing protein 9-like protein [Lasius niger]